MWMIATRQKINHSRRLVAFALLQSLELPPRVRHLLVRDPILGRALYRAHELAADMIPDALFAADPTELAPLVIESPPGNMHTSPQRQWTVGTSGSG